MVKFTHIKIHTQKKKKSNANLLSKFILKLKYLEPTYPLQIISFLGEYQENTIYVTMYKCSSITSAS